MGRQDPGPCTRRQDPGPCTRRQDPGPFTRKTAPGNRKPAFTLFSLLFILLGFHPAQADSYCRLCNASNFWNSKFVKCRYAFNGCLAKCKGTSGNVRNRMCKLPKPGLCREKQAVVTDSEVVFGTD